MWTKEDLQNKYIKINSEEDYNTILSVLHELGIQQYYCYKGETYQSKFNSVFITDDSYYFLTESNYSDIPIQQFYDYLASKLLKVENLIEGEIYVGKHTIYKWNGKSNNLYRIFRNTFHKDDNPYWDVNSPDRIADSEEKKHLEVCIKQDKFIPKEDLHLYDDTTFELKSLQTIPEYVELLPNFDNSKTGKIFKTSEEAPWYYLKGNYNSIWEWLIKDIHSQYFKPSTKEAYEAQNKFQFEVGKWYKSNIEASYWYYLKVNSFDADYVYGERIFKDGNLEYSYEEDSYWDSKDSINQALELGPLTDLSEIQQYLPDGHPDKIKPMEINEFRKCLPHEIPNNTTQKVIKEMSKEELLEEAKRRYPVGTKCICLTDGKVEEITSDLDWLFSDNRIAQIEGSKTIIYYNGKWAEIVELPKDYVIGIDPHNVGIYPVYEKDIEPIKEYSLTLNEAFQQEGLIDTTVNKIQSVSVELYQPEELQLF